LISLPIQENYVGSKNAVLWDIFTAATMNSITTLLQFASVYAIMKVRKIGWNKLNGTHQFMTYADDVNLLRDNIDIINKITDILFHASREAGLQVNIEKISICWYLVTRMQIKIRT
jgi:hypothetical protein